MYSLLWSEHCAYKHSKKLLRTLPTEGEHVVWARRERGRRRRRWRPRVRVQGRVPQPPERRGAVPGCRHRRRRDPARHLRDRRSTDCRARLAALRRTGGPAGARARYLLDGAVSGIGHYGNSIGVPTVGGELYFEGPYEQNCLVNAMALGLAPRERLVRSAAAGPGNVLILFGASTGRDGIGGASVLASAELGEGDADKRPTVQVGDPFEEKKLLECSLELLERGLLVSLQDLGAAGLTSSAVGDGLQGRRRDRPGRRRGAAARAGHGAIRGDGQRVPGADAVRRRARGRRRRDGAVREVGGGRLGDRHGHRHRADARAARRQLLGDMPVARAGRRLPAV